MSTMKYLFLTFTIICAFQEIQVHARRGTHVGNRKNSNDKVVAYMGCDIHDRRHYDTDFLRPSCNITIEIPSVNYPVSGSTDRVFCNINKPPFTNMSNLYYEISAVANQHVVILYGTGRSWAKIRILRTRECRYRDVYLDVDPLRYDDFGTAEINVTLNDNTFDVFYEDKRNCPSGACMVTYDFNGRLLEDPIDVYRPTNNIMKNKDTFVFGEQYVGNIGFVYDYESIKLVRYRQENASDVLFRLPRQSVTVLSISTKDKFFSLCYKWNNYRKANCLQYNDKGRQVMNNTFFFSNSWTSLRIRNRYWGGFSMSATNCTINDCDPERDIYTLEFKEQKVKYSKPFKLIPLFCRSRVGNKAELEIGFDYATYLNCKPSMKGHSYTFMFKWCSEFIRCNPVL